MFSYTKGISQVEPTNTYLANLSQTARTLWNLSESDKWSTNNVHSENSV